MALRLTPPPVQVEIPWHNGTPEGVLAAPPGHLVVDFIPGNLYIKQSAANLKTGWKLLSGGDTTIITDGALVLFGNGSPQGIVQAVPGRLYMNRLTFALWIKLTGIGTTGWFQITGPFE